MLQREKVGLRRTRNGATGRSVKAFQFGDIDNT